MNPIQNNSLRLVPEDRTSPRPVITFHSVSAWFGARRVLRNIDVGFQPQQVNCIIGPSGSGKSTLIRSINRINDEVDGYKQEGAIRLDGRDIFDRNVDPVDLRSRVGMVFQKPCVFPTTISRNVLFGIRNARKLSGREKMRIVEENLRAVSLWHEVSHRLEDPADSLSLGQQQRLCMARTLAVEPDVILMDEPTSSLDPVSTRAIEELVLRLKENYTILYVTHDLPQARRIADRLIFLCDGEVIEQGPAALLLSNPADSRTSDFVEAQGYPTAARLPLSHHVQPQKKAD